MSIRYQNLAQQASGLGEADFNRMRAIAHKTGTILVTYSVNPFASSLIESLGSPNVQAKGLGVKLNTSNWGPMAGFITTLLPLQKINEQHSYDFAAGFSDSIDNYTKIPLSLSLARLNFLIANGLLQVSARQSKSLRNSIYLEPIDPYKPEQVNIIFEAKRIIMAEKSYDTDDDYAAPKWWSTRYGHYDPNAEFAIFYCVINEASNGLHEMQKRSVEVLCDNNRPIVADLDLLMVIHSKQVADNRHRVFNTANSYEYKAFMDTIMHHKSFLQVDDFSLAVAIDGDDSLTRQGNITPFELFISRYINENLAHKVMHGPASNRPIDVVSLDDQFCVFADRRLLSMVKMHGEWFNSLRKYGVAMLTKNELFLFFSQVLVDDIPLHIPMHPSWKEYLTKEAQISLAKHVVDLPDSHNSSTESSNNIIAGDAMMKQIKIVSALDTTDNYKKGKNSFAQSKYASLVEFWHDVFQDDEQVEDAVDI